MDNALKELKSQGMKSLVLDVRQNPGGLLTTAVDLLDRFIADGILVSTRGREPSQNQTHTAHAPGTWNIPIVLLIDENSASASEIVAGAFRDHRRPNWSVATRSASGQSRASMTTTWVTAAGFG